MNRERLRILAGFISLRSEPAMPHLNAHADCGWKIVVPDAELVPRYIVTHDGVLLHAANGCNRIAAYALFVFDERVGWWMDYTLDDAFCRARDLLGLTDAVADVLFRQVGNDDVVHDLWNGTQGDPYTYESMAAVCEELAADVDGDYQRMAEWPIYSEDR